MKANGSVVAWGDNHNGQVTVPDAARNNVQAIAAGWGYTVILKDDGSVLVWGEINDVPAAARGGVVKIAADFEHIVALKDNGSVIA